MSRRPPTLGAFQAADEPAPTCPRFSPYAG